MQFFLSFSFIFYNELLISNLRIGGWDKLFVQNIILVDLRNTVQNMFLASSYVVMIILHIPVYHTWKLSCMYEKQY